jgi:hypothetical protein
MLLFLDESGHDHSGTPCEVLAGVAVAEDNLWNLVRGRPPLANRSVLPAFGPIGTMPNCSVSSSRRSNFTMAGMSALSGKDSIAPYRVFVVNGITRTPIHKFSTV